MPKHKRRRPKNRRAGCLMCKPHKVNGASPKDRYRISELRRIQPEECARTSRVGPVGIEPTT